MFTIFDAQPALTKNGCQGSFPEGLRVIVGEAEHSHSPTADVWASLT